MNETILAEEYALLKDHIEQLRSENSRLSTLTYVGRVIKIGEKTLRVITEEGRVIEIEIPKENKIKEGAKIILNHNWQMVDSSEFDDDVGQIATISQVYENKLKVDVDGQGRIVYNILSNCKTGDKIILDRSLSLAVQKLEKEKSNYLLENIVNAPWSNIGGLEEILTKIKQEVEEPLIHQKLFEKYGRKPAKGILLYGPPGCGKTMIAKSIAYSLAQMKGDTAVVFVDEADAILKTRGSGISTDAYDSIVAQFLTEMDGVNGFSKKEKKQSALKSNGHFIKINGPEILDKYLGNSEAIIRKIYKAARGAAGNVITVFATNREEVIDSAILREGRVDRKIKVPRPSKQGAEQIFKIYLKDKPLQHSSVDELSKDICRDIYDGKNKMYNVISSKGELLGNFRFENIISGAMIKGVVDRACDFAIEREKNGLDSGLNKDDLYRSLKDKYNENRGLKQILTKNDWEDVFSEKGKEFYEAYQKGYLLIEKTNEKDTYKIERRGA